MIRESGLQDLVVFGVAADAVQTLSWFKALLILLPFPAWAWVISTVYDKHALRFHLKRENWNAIHLTLGLVAFAAGLGVPALAGLGGFIGVLVGLVVVIAVLGVDLWIYPMQANKDERVPAEHRVKLDFSKLKEAREKKAAAKEQGKVDLVIFQPDKQRVAPPMAETPEFELRAAAEKIVLAAREARATRLDFQPAGNGTYAAAYTVDGVPQRGESMPAQMGVQVIDFWKAAGLLDVADRRRKQVADIRLENGEDHFTARMRTSGSKAGPVLSLIFDQKKSVRRTLDFLGLHEGQRDSVEQMIKDGSGHVVLVASPQRMGRTTTLYTVVKMHDAYTSNVQTLELELEDMLEGVKQVQFDPTAEGADLGTMTRTLLRRDPDVLGVAEIDAGAAQQIANGDLDGTRVYACLRASSAMSAIRTWMKAVGDPKLAAESLRGVVTQRLVRKLCENCRQQYQPSADMLKKLGLRPEQAPGVLYKKGGQVLVNKKPEVCPVCGGSGYIGQEGIFEVYEIGPEEKAALASGNEQAIRAALRKQGLPSMQQAALKKALDGVTSIEEVIRVTSESKPAQPQKAAAGAES